MAYNNVFPIGYQPTNYQSVNYGQPQYNQQNHGQVGLIWVQGIEGAKSYLVAPNTTIQLWDSEKQVIYLKSADASGMPSMKILDYTIRDNDNTSNVITNNNEYVTKEAFNELSRKMEEVEKKIKEIGAFDDEPAF